MRLARTTAVVGLAAYPALAQHALELPDFSATQMTPGREAMASKIYRSGNNFRSEPGSNQEIAFIFLPDSGKVLNVILKGTQCIEMTTAQSHAVRSPVQTLSGAKVDKLEATTETLDGHVCKVESVTVKGEDGKETQFKIWQAEDKKGAPLKIEIHAGLNTLTTIYKNIVVGTPDPALFKSPVKCVPFEKTYQIAPASK